MPADVTKPDTGSFLAGLEPREAEALQSRGVLRHYSRGTALFHERQHADRVIVLLRGRTKLSCLSEDGKEIVLAIRGPGDLLGEQSAIDQEPRSATAIALEPVEALVLAASDFRSFLERHPKALLYIVKTLSQRLRDADRKRLEFAAYDCMSRLATRILELSERYGRATDKGMRVDLPISQHELAGWAGCSREAVTKALQSMRTLGWIETRRRLITVLDLDALRRRTL